MGFKIKNKNKTITSSRITQSTLNSLSIAAQKHLSDEDAQLLVRAIESNLARPMAIENLRKYKSMF